MNKKIILSVAAATLLSASAVFAGGPEIIIQPDYFSGFYVGGIGSLHLTGFDSNTETFVPDSVILTPAVLVPGLFPVVTSANLIPAGTGLAAQNGGSSFNGYGGVQGGFGKVFNHQWYLGIVGWGEWGTASQTSSIASNNGPGSISTSPILGGFFVGNVNTNGTTLSQTTMKVKNDYGVAAKLGYVITPTTMVYGKIGGIWANLEIENSAAVSGRVVTTSNPLIAPVIAVNYTGQAVLSGSSSNSDTKSALLLGIGAEQFIYRDMISLNVEYEYAEFGDISTSTNLTISNASSTEQLLVGGVPVLTTGTAALAAGTGTSATTSATASARVSIIQAGLNFYFGRNWI